MQQNNNVFSVENGNSIITALIIVIIIKAFILHENGR